MSPPSSIACAAHWNPARYGQPWHKRSFDTRIRSNACGAAWLITATEKHILHALSTGHQAHADLISPHCYRLANRSLVDVHSDPSCILGLQTCAAAERLRAIDCFLAAAAQPVLCRLNKAASLCSRHPAAGGCDRELLQPQLRKSGRSLTGHAVQHRGGCRLHRGPEAAAPAPGPGGQPHHHHPLRPAYRGGLAAHGAGRLPGLPRPERCAPVAAADCRLACWAGLNRPCRLP